MGPGLAKARRGAFLRRGVLSREAEQLLFLLAERMSEGDVRQQTNHAVYGGSTMLSIDLQQLANKWRGPLDIEALRTAIEGSVRVRIRVMRIACADAAQRCPELALGTAEVETRVHIRGGQLLVDVDLEAPLSVRSGTGTSRR